MTMYKYNTPPTPGMRIMCRDAEWLVNRVESFEYANEHALHCVGVDDLVRGHQSIFLTQLDTIEPVDPRKTQLVIDDSNGYKLSKLFVEAQLRQIPSTGIEPDLKGMGVFNPMNFQEEAVKRALLQLRPRLLLADAVGLGKTIEVGMILSELMRRGRADRILVLAKKSMLTQFQAELWNRFNIPLVRLDSEGIKKLRLRIPANKNPFEVFHRVIISIDTLKNVGRYEHFLNDTRWDVVIIDEAHNVAGANVPQRHLSYRLARLLARHTDSMLLTTATPHNGKKETFGRLISLLDPSAIPDPDLKEYDAEDIKNFFMMRFKEDIREEAADLLSKREIIPREHTTENATEDEENVYQALAELREACINDRENLTSSDNKRKITALLQYGLYKLFLSSPEACLKTITNRIEKLNDSDFESGEMTHLKKISGYIKKLTIQKSSRYKILKKQLEEIGWNGKPESPRVLVFTEYRETQDALANALAKDFKLKYSEKFDAQPQQCICSIHGSTPDTHLMKTVEAFATGSSPIRIMIATDVASEGINLHHECHHIIHYDLPWSIITLIQRNGRIDRLGQKKNPVMRYLMVNTNQGLLSGDKDIFERLIYKAEEINNLRKTGESVLQLYDPEKEEEYIANKGILAGNTNIFEKPAPSSISTDNEEANLIELMLKQANQEGHNDFTSFLLDENDGGVEPTNNLGAELDDKSRLYQYSDKDFLIEGYHYLQKQNSDYLPLEKTGKLVILTAPKDLKRRLGASEKRTEHAAGVIFGATAIPEESWPKNDQFRLTDDPDQVDLAIKAARNLSGYWSNEMLCNQQHPILKWLTERLLMGVKRDEAPIIISKHLQPGELCFCFIGQVSSKAGTPLIVDGHAFSYFKGGKFEYRSLKDALENTKFDQLINTGQVPNIKAAQPLIHAAVSESLSHMLTLKTKREKRLRKPLMVESRRLKKWSQKRDALLKKRIDQYGTNHVKSKRLQKEIEEMNEYIRDREKNWYNTHFEAASNPSTRLIIVIQGA